MIKVDLKDGRIKEYHEGISIQEVADSLSVGLARALVGAVDGTVQDLSHKLTQDCRV
jgi:threonyl-tRNA synthetase